MKNLIRKTWCKTRFAKHCCKVFGPNTQLGICGKDDDNDVPTPPPTPPNPTPTPPAHSWWDKEYYAGFEFVEVRDTLDVWICGTNEWVTLDQLIERSGINAVRMCAVSEPHIWHEHGAIAKVEHNGIMKFDLTQYNQHWLDMLRWWAEECAKREIHVVYDLWDFCNMKHAGTVEAWRGSQNHQGIVAGGDIRAGFLQMSEPLHSYQVNLMRKIVETIGDLPNVAIQFGNEPEGGQNHEWHGVMNHELVVNIGFDPSRIHANTAVKSLNLEWLSYHTSSRDLHYIEHLLEEGNHNGDHRGKVIISTDQPDGWNTATLEDVRDAAKLVFSKKAGHGFFLCVWQKSTWDLIEGLKQAVEEVS